MKVSLSWLKDYVQIESVSERYRYLDTVFVGRIEEIAPHPNADKLHLCQVDTGQGKVSVVCGAPNAKTGMLSPIALPGTEFPDGFVLEKSVIRGQASEGMLCSEGERIAAGSWYWIHPLPSAKDWHGPWRFRIPFLKLR
jgi:phenylalanyl-tRNA synthetase beta chain